MDESMEMEPPELTVSMPSSSGSRAPSSYRDIVVSGRSLSVQKNLDSLLDSALSLESWRSLPDDVQTRLRDDIQFCREIRVTDLTFHIRGHLDTCCLMARRA